MKKFFKILFIILAILTMFEYYFISGLFTGTFMLIAICITGIINLIISAIDRNLNETALYIISTMALMIGYLKIM